jgi:two-component system, response regulator PdtaR
LSYVPSMVLVAEDEPLASMALRAQLEAMGLDVVGPARDGDEAVALGRCFPADIAIFDFRMPRKTGLQAAEILFPIAPTPVILLSGFDARDLPDRIPRPPIFASLTKPAEIKDLRAALDSAAAQFHHWLTAEPARRDRTDALRAERADIAEIMAAHAPDRGHARLALRLTEAAALQDRPLLDVARDLDRETSRDG